jgi:hypothetical protein
MNVVVCSFLRATALASALYWTRQKLATGEVLLFASEISGTFGIRPGTGAP